jgi:1-acyl-sn-glycerol-3-phosphate acyltransferase
MNIPVLPFRQKISESFLISISVFAILVVVIPFWIFHHSIYTTKYVYLVIVAPFFIARVIDNVIGHTLVTDALLTLIILPISAPVLVVLGLLGVLTIFLFPKTTYFAVWIVCGVVLFMMGVRLKYKGTMPDIEGAYLIAGNHGSFLDYFLLLFCIGPRPSTIMYGTNLLKYPILSFFLKRYGIGVDRENKDSRLAAKEAMQSALARGLPVVVFPEGTRMRSHQIDKVLLSFKNGPFASAIEMNVPIVPIVCDLPILFSKPDRPLPLSPRTITVTYCDVQYPEGKNRKTLRDDTKNLMQSVLEKN